ncbi:MAG TPA: D-alanine--D-alanine ligase, partial [Polyangiaceae bacterium]|nr:D-alanine--D-alanine ligase [Polyangiaceae bacterium]
MTSSKRVGVVMGGTTGEREVSLRSGAAVAGALERLGHEVVPVILGEGTDAFLAIAAADLDVAFLALHGRLGEDGCIQGLLELMGIPYTGSSVLSSALAMDKLKAKEMFRLHNVPTPPYYTVEGPAAVEHIADLHGCFGFPVVVKPRREGSSVGVSCAANMTELLAGLERAMAHDEAVIVERFI